MPNLIVSCIWCSTRADAFTAKSSAELAEWFQSIGLDMYSDLAEEKMLTGESLANMVVEDSSLVVSEVSLYFLILLMFVSMLAS